MYNTSCDGISKVKQNSKYQSSKIAEGNGTPGKWGILGVNALYTIPSLLFDCRHPWGIVF